jgi:DNA (cytosine-5)-methyltransferase 1
MIKAADLFCGAGGSSLGAHWAGVKVLIAMNHWALALDSHSKNFGDTAHVYGDVAFTDLRSMPNDIDLLMASPECTRHSTASGKLRWTPEAEGSRATAWQVYRYAKEMRPRWLVVENVRQIQLWDEYEIWLKAIEALGYKVRVQILNAADFGVPQNRIRWFLLGDLEKEPGEVKPTVKKHVPALSIIDWTYNCPSIFGRKKRLADSTLNRILVGLKKFCSKEKIQPFITKMRNNNPATSLEKPLHTVATGGHHALTIPYLVTPRHTGSDESRVRDLNLPMWTVTTSNGAALVAPFLLPQNAGAVPRDLSKPMTTVMAHGPGASLVAPFMVAYYTGGAQAHSVAKPVPTITTLPKFGLVGAKIGDPPKLPRRDKHGIVEFMRAHGIVDIGFRMLQPDELQRAMGFPDEYVIKGNKAETVKQLGNAVAPPVMRAIVETLCQITR